MSSRKEIVRTFLEMSCDGRVRDAYAKHVAKGFKHHNAYFKGDAESLMLGMEQNAKENPDKKLAVKHVIEEGDLVVVHSHVKHNAKEPGFGLAHIFKFDGDKIVELWDLAQEVPATSPNQYGMF